MKRFLKILIKILSALILLGFLVFGILYAIYNEPLPEGRPGPEAEAMAEKMLKTINNEAYKNTRFMEWSYAGGAHTYKWDKENGKVTVRWNDYIVHLNLNDTSKSVVSDLNKQLSGKEASEVISTAWNYFNNDSFWLVAPFKVFDKGTNRSVVSLADGSEGLMVSYTQGGTTPGDSYLWKLDANGFPESYQMWVKIIPIGGIASTWEGWQAMESGVFLPTAHKLGPITLGMGEVKAYN